MDKGLAAAPQSEAAQVACAMLAAGGNAFDAAIAGALAQGVVDPHRSGIGGFGAAILYAAREGGRGVLYAVSADGRVRQRLVLADGDVREPAWSPYRIAR